ncbi:hypothetical protein J2W30_006687 [Variovorax boronicumulans]|nr:hypothetical protein [Variovorax boronicumulans]MDQ0612204.1 hypothetical protein [Variovorax sp. W1I1]
MKQRSGKLNKFEPSDEEAHGAILPLLASGV